MNKITRNIAALIAFGIGTTTIGFAQVTQQKIGNNPTIINPSAVIEVESANKGFLAPRVALTNTNNFSPITGLAAADQHTANSLLVYNTATAGDVTPGYYYWQKPTVAAPGKWVRLIDAPADVRRIGTNHISEDAGVGSNGSTIPGNANVAIGPGAMNSVSVGTHPFGFTGNIAIGGGDQLAKITGAGNVAIGYANLPNATSGTNLAIGALNLPQATTADANVVVGSSNMSAVTTGSSNISMGISNLSALTTGSNNHVVGNMSLRAITTQSQNLAFGADVLPTAVGNKNIGVGSTVLNTLGTGDDNVGLGVASGGALTTGSYNTFFGTEAGNRLLGAATERYNSGDFSLFLGSQTKAKNTGNNQLNIQNYIYGESGNLAFGDFTGVNALPTITSTNRLDVVTGNVRVRQITNAYTLQTADKVVVADNLGVLRTVNTSALIPATTNNLSLTGKNLTSTVNGESSTANLEPLVTAANGLTENGTAIELGGTLNRGTTVAINGHSLNFNNTIQQTSVYDTGGLSQEGLSNEGSIIIRSADANTNGRQTNLSLQSYDDNAAQIFAGEGATRLTIGTHYTAVPAPIVFTTNQVANTLSTEKMRLTPTGELAIGATSAPSFTVGGATIQPKLHVAGDISTTGKVWTTNSVYADYVFEKYFGGKSEINPNYEFKSLDYVRNFIKANNHLPGVTSIADLGKANNGYTFDMTKLTIQSLEKIEELYIHTIEQQDTIEKQQSEIEALKKQAQDTEERLQRLEKLLLNKKN
ncbi:SlyX family protein [Paenimyroides aestuarii]|uniref:SlyX family protein n=1 Tax=Paenimyroides aestuarii TaxID=2968490 RepID=A0ABY5NV37_9FLAO|nr:SlyX family protein [Paenimyroides aestuarii]UUV22322.1 SlyX family protein [Paenimyroides aestuarii]